MSSIVKPAISLSEDTRQALAEETVEEGQVTVHVQYGASYAGELIRVWPTTYLIPQHGEHRSRLVSFDKIALAPFWTVIRRAGLYRFTLIFSPLPKNCDLFHLWEDIDQPHPFIIRNIKRNNTDVYEVELA